MSGLGLVPIGGTVVGPVRRTRTNRVRPTARPCGAGGVEQYPAPCVERRPRAVGGEHGKVGSKADRHGFEVAVPAAAKGPSVQPDGLLVERVQGSQEKCSTVASCEQHRPARWGSVWEQEPTVERRSRVAGKPELAVLEDQRSQAVRRLAFCSFAWRERWPCDRRPVERAGRDVREIDGRLAAEHHQRAGIVGSDRAAHLGVDDGDRRCNT